MPRQIIVSNNGHTDIVPTGPVGPPGATGAQGPPGIQGIQGPQGLGGAVGHGVKLMQGVTTDIGGTEYQVFDLTDPENNWGQYVMMAFDDANPTVQRYLVDLPDPDDPVVASLPVMTMVLISFNKSITKDFQLYLRTPTGGIQEFMQMETLWPFYSSNGWPLKLMQINTEVFGAPAPGDPLWWFVGESAANSVKGVEIPLSSEGTPSTTTVADIAHFQTKTAIIDAGGTGQTKVEVMLPRVFVQEEIRFNIWNAEDVDTVELIADDGYGTPHTRILTGASLEAVRTGAQNFEFIMWPKADGVDNSFIIDSIAGADISALEGRMDTAETNIGLHGGRLDALELVDNADWGGFSTPTLPWHEVDHAADGTPVITLDHGYAVEEHIIGASGAVVDIKWTNPGAGKIARQHLKLRASDTIGSFGNSQTDITVNGEGWPTVASTWSLYDIWIVGQGTEYSGDPAAVYVNTLMHNITFGT